MTWQISLFHRKSFKSLVAYQSVIVAGCENPIAYSLSLHNYFWREAVTCAGWHQAVEQQEQTWMTGLSYSLGACAM